MKKLLTCLVLVAILVSNYSSANSNDWNSNIPFSLQLTCSVKENREKPDYVEHYLDDEYTQYVCVKKEKILTQNNFISACVESTEFYGEEKLQIRFGLDKEGRSAIKKVTTDYKGEIISVIVDDTHIIKIGIIMTIDSDTFVLKSAYNNKISFVIEKLNINEKCLK